MTAREQLYYLLLQLKQGNYNVTDFSDLFTDLVNLELNPEDCSEKEYRVFCALANYTCRFSQFPEDHLALPGGFYDEETIQTRAAIAIEELGQETVQNVVNQAVANLRAETDED